MLRLLTGKLLGALLGKYSGELPGDFSGKLLGERSGEAYWGIANRLSILFPGAYYS